MQLEGQSDLTPNRQEMYVLCNRMSVSYTINAAAAGAYWSVLVAPQWGIGH